MNIQINCKSNITDEDLTYIGYNLKNIIREYEETKNGFSHKKYVNGKAIWYKHLNGSWVLNENIDVTCNGKTMYFKINKEAKK